MMKNPIVLFVFLLFLCVGTAQHQSQDIQSKTITKNKSKLSQEKSIPQLLKRIEKLENDIRNLQAQINGQETKTRLAFMQISSDPIFNSPFEDFVFASDNLWNNPVDVGLVECSKRCSKAAKQRRNSCSKMKDGEEKKQCYASSANDASKCQNACQKRFPPKQ